MFGIDKNALIKKLQSDPTYRAALKMVKTEEERRRIIYMCEGLISSFSDAFSPVITRANSDPEYASKMKDELSKSGLVKESDGKAVPADPKVESSGE